MATDRATFTTVDRLLTQGRSDLQHLDVYPAAIPAWTKLIEDLHLRSMAGEKSAGGVRWVHRQAMIVWNDGTIEIVPNHDWDQVPVDRQGTLEWMLVEDGTAAIVVASVHRVAQPDEVEIRLYGSTIDAPLRLFDRISSRHVLRHS